MKCPKCGSSLIYEDELDEEWYDTSHWEKWLVICPAKGCDFEGKLWQNYHLESEEWANEENHSEEVSVP